MPACSCSSDGAGGTHLGDRYRVESRLLQPLIAVLPPRRWHPRLRLVHATQGNRAIDRPCFAAGKGNENVVIEELLIRWNILRRRHDVEHDSPFRQPLTQFRTILFLE